MNLAKHIADQWLSKLKLSADHKWREFGADAVDALRVYNGPHDFLYNSAYGITSRSLVISGNVPFPEPTFRMTVNKVSELVQLFLPVLYHRNPVRQVNPRKINFPPELLAAIGMQNNPTV